MSRETNTVRIGNDEIALRSDQAPIVFVDAVTEYRAMNGVVYVSLATSTQDGAGPLTVEVVGRLRMSLVTAQILRDMLGNIGENALKPADTTKAN